MRANQEILLNFI